MGIKSKMHKFETISADKPISSALFILEEGVIDDAILVTKGDEIVGILTATDLLTKVSSKELESKSIKIKDVMSSPVITIDSNKDIKEAIDIMTKNKIEKLPVIENGKPIGILYGEDILELDEEKMKDVIFSQTVEEVYKIMIREPDIDCVSILEITRQMDKFSDMDSKVEFDLFVYQEGIVLVAYNYIKENPNKKLDAITIEIKENYLGLLDRYGEKEDSE